jgi:hypothetical protein
MQNVSNSPLAESEYERFVRHCSRSSRRMLTKEDVRDNARKKIDAAESYRWDASKVREAIERKRASGQAPANIAAEKARLKRLLEDATTRGAAEEVSALEERLADAEARGAASHPGNTRMYAMGDLNKRNNAVNFNNAFTNVSNKPAGATTKAGGADPFSRRNTRPSIYWNTKGAEAVAAEQAQLAQAKLNSAASVIAVKASMEAAKLSARQMKLDPAQLIRQLDIGVDLALLQQPTLPQVCVCLGGGGGGGGRPGGPACGLAARGREDTISLCPDAQMPVPLVAPALPSPPSRVRAHVFAAPHSPPNPCSCPSACSAATGRRASAALRPQKTRAC